MEPRLTFVLETSLYVSDLRRAIAFYTEKLGLRVITEFPDGVGAALEAGPSVLLLFRPGESRKGNVLPPHGADGQGHVAFRVEPHEIDLWRARLRELEIPIEQEFTFGDNPPSLYFRDPDGNLLEIAVDRIWRG